MQVLPVVLRLRSSKYYSYAHCRSRQPVHSCRCTLRGNKNHAHGKRFSRLANDLITARLATDAGRHSGIAGWFIEEL